MSNPEWIGDVPLNLRSTGQAVASMDEGDARLGTDGAEAPI